MKRKLLTFAITIFATLGATANAQDTFYPGFQWGVKGGVGYTVGETSNIGKLISPSAGIDLGYQFTPVFTLRADIAGWQGKGVFLENPWTMNYAHLTADAVFDICNMVNFKADRIVNPYFFAGIGAQVRFNNKATGASDYNMALSEKRAVSVAKALEAKGIDKSRIITWSYGDTAQLMEISRKNRVCVMICK